MRFLFKKIKYNIVIFKKMARTTKNTKTSTTKGKKNDNAKDKKKEVKDKRTFNVYYDGVDVHTHPKGDQPRQAARKAVVPIIRYLLTKKGITDKEEQKKNTDYINKKLIFYITEPKKIYDEDEKKMVPLENPPRHYYIGERTGIKPNIVFYLTKGKGDNKEIIDIKDFKGKITVEKNGKRFDAKDYKGGDITKDKDLKVVKVEVPRKFPIYKTTVEKGENGKEIKRKEKIGEDIKYIEYKFSNEVFKLTLEKYNEFKSELKLTKKQEEELMKYIDKPKRQPKEKKESDNEEEEKPKKGRGKKQETKAPEEEKQSSKKGPKKGRK